jgi:hypothetical protein
MAHLVRSLAVRDVVRKASAAKERRFIRVLGQFADEHE